MQKNRIFRVHYKHQFQMNNQNTVKKYCSYLNFKQYGFDLHYDIELSPML